MQILWKKYSKENFEVNVDECGIEQGYHVIWDYQSKYNLFNYVLKGGNV